MSDRGRLIVCATPIGNLGDVTPRVVEALKQADTVLAEDTRVTRRLFARYGITTPLERYDEHVAARDTDAFVERLRAGAVFALVSDAGTPGVSDPGATLVDRSLSAGVNVEVLPGPSAIITALVASGLPTHAFYFGGFLPRKAGERQRLLDGLNALDATLIFYESPHRTVASVEALAETFPLRSGAMARELTKIHEEIVRAPLQRLAQELGARDQIKGEVVLLVSPPAPGEREKCAPDDSEVRMRVDALVDDGFRRAEAVKRVAAEFGWSRKAVYELAHRDDE